VLLMSLIVAGALGIDPAYLREVDSWREQRLVRLKADGGWLTLAGLAWLKPGVNRFGSDPTNEVVLPSHGAAAHLGQFVLDSGQVTVDVAPGAGITLAGKAVTRTVLRTDANGDPDVLVLGPLTMQIIARGERFGVRIKDNESESRLKLHGLRWYPVKPEYRVTARFVAHGKPTTIPIPSIIGVTEAMPSPGRVTFELGGKTVSLDPVLEPGDERLFFIFRDATSGHATYGAGRFLYADPPKDGRVILDFNKAYSPPCAFTPYATCPLPPPQNRLPLPIEAGEMNPAR
jgi:uncharacterized protein (DUF1684 family)